MTNELHGLTFVELWAGNLDRAAEVGREAVAVAAQGERVDAEMNGLFRLGWVAALRGNVDEARDLCARSLRLAEQSSGFSVVARG